MYKLHDSYPNNVLDLCQINSYTYDGWSIMIEGGRVPIIFQGRIQDFKLGGGAHLKKLRRAEGGAKIVGVFRVKNHDFTPKNHILSNFKGGRRVPPPPPLDPPLYLIIIIDIWFLAIIPGRKNVERPLGCYDNRCIRGHLQSHSRTVSCVKTQQQCHKQTALFSANKSYKKKLNVCYVS